jgi:hypothetical protein
LRFDKNEVTEAGESFDMVSEIKIVDKAEEKQSPPEDYRVSSM